MARTRRYTITAVSTSGSVGTFYSPYVSGYLESIAYTKDGTTPYTNGVDFTITSEATGEAIWVDTNIDATETVLPSAPTCSVAGVASLYAGSGEAVNTRIALGRDRVKIVLAAAGATKTGTFVVTMADA
jgi:hypothetical protein